MTKQITQIVCVQLFHIEGEANGVDSSPLHSNSFYILIAELNDFVFYTFQRVRCVCVWIVDVYVVAVAATVTAA